MLARNTTSLPAAAACAGGCLYEPKFDGFRCLAFQPSVDGRVELQSRQGRPLAGAFPEIARLVRDHLPPGSVVDGELVIWSGNRLDFSLLQRRLSAGPRKVIDWAAEHPAHLVLFDVLQVSGCDVRSRPLRERRQLLEEMLVDVPPQLTLSPQTESVDQAREWLETWPAAGVEGLVIKAADEPYRPGKRGWLKLRQRRSAEAIVGGVTGSLGQPETLLLGRRDTAGVLRFVGRTRPVTAVQRGDLRKVLQRHGSRGRWTAEHPWPRPLPAGWIGQWGSTEPLVYVPVEPDTIVEVEVDAAYVDGRWRHQTKLIRLRVDMSIYDVPLADPPP